MPTKVVSGAHVSVTVKITKDSIPYEVTGFSDDADAVSFQDDLQIIDTKRGMDRGVSYFPTPDVGGTLTMKLLPSSPSVKFFVHAANKTKTSIYGEDPQVLEIYEIVVDDSLLVEKTTAKQCIMESISGGPEYGAGSARSRSFMFQAQVFEDDVSGFDGASIGTSGDLAKALSVAAIDAALSGTTEDDEDGG